jgi:hypothetical protein
MMLDDGRLDRDDVRCILYPTIAAHYSILLVAFDSFCALFVSMYPFFYGTIPHWRMVRPVLVPNDRPLLDLKRRLKTTVITF